MDNDRVLTVAIAAYNVEATLSETIESIINNNQILDKIEILIINDGSKDSTKQIADDYKKRFPNTITVINKPNGGYGSTVNVAIANANGKYFKLLDGDDWFETAELTNFIKNLQSSNADLYLNPYVKIIGNNKRREEQARRSITNIDQEVGHLKNTDLCGILMPEITIKTSILKNNNITLLEHCFYTDVEFIYFALKYSHSINYDSSYVYKYRIGNINQSISIKSRVRNLQDTEEVERVILSDYAKDNKSHSEAINTAIRTLLVNTAIAQYYTYLLAKPEKTIKEKLKIFDSFVLEHDKEVYLIVGSSSKIIRLLRSLKFEFLWLFHLYVMNKEN